MTKMTQQALHEILYLHSLWLKGIKKGKKANLSNANLSYANLSGVNLNKVILTNANLYKTNLTNADLSYSILVGANFKNADLTNANLSYANLYKTNLTNADLSHAYLKEANLSYAILDLCLNFPQEEIDKRQICPKGEFLGYKKLNDDSICTLKIPANSQRVGGIVSRKCRAEYAIVVKGNGRSIFNSGFTYAEGQEVRPCFWDPDPLVDCAGGIHFFLTENEAMFFYF